MTLAIGHLLEHTWCRVLWDLPAHAHFSSSHSNQGSPVRTAPQSTPASALATPPRCPLHGVPWDTQPILCLSSSCPTRAPLHRVPWGTLACNHHNFSFPTGHPLGGQSTEYPSLCPLQLWTLTREALEWSAIWLPAYVNHSSSASQTYQAHTVYTGNDHTQDHSFKIRSSCFA